MRPPITQHQQYRQPTFRMGHPRAALDKALELVAGLEDEETIRTLRRTENREA